MIMIVPRGLTLPTGSVALYAVCPTPGLLNYKTSAFAMPSIGLRTVPSRNSPTAPLGMYNTPLSNVAILTSGVFATTHATANWKNT